MEVFELDGGARFVAKDDMIVSWIRAKEGRQFEPETRRWIFDQLAVRPGCFVDVGASTGWYAVQLALAGIDVLAIEPNPKVIKRLEQNIQLNGVAARVEIVRAAAAAVAGDAVLNVNPAVPLTSGASLDPRIRSNANRERVTVQAVKVSSAVGDRKVGILKCDVEGYEIPALEGAASVIWRDRPALVIEANDPAAETACRAWLDQEGYSADLVDERNLLCLPR
jgi:FkbM family methyltransferase